MNRSIVASNVESPDRKRPAAWYPLMKVQFLFYVSKDVTNNISSPYSLLISFHLMKKGKLSFLLVVVYIHGDSPPTLSEIMMIPLIQMANERFKIFPYTLIRLLSGEMHFYTSHQPMLYFPMRN